MSEFIGIFVKFSNFMSRGWGFLAPCSVPKGGFLYTTIVPGKGFCSIQVVSFAVTPTFGEVNVIATKQIFLSKTHG